VFACHGGTEFEGPQERYSIQPRLLHGHCCLVTRQDHLGSPLVHHSCLVDSGENAGLNVLQLVLHLSLRSCAQMVLRSDADADQRGVAAPNTRLNNLGSLRGIPGKACVMVLAAEKTSAPRISTNELWRNIPKIR
jgi:hypothetical protein